MFYDRFGVDQDIKQVNEGTFTLQCKKCDVYDTLKGTGVIIEPETNTGNPV